MLESNKPTRPFVFANGVLLGLLLASAGMMTMMKSLFPEPRTLIVAKFTKKVITTKVPGKVVTIEKVVEKEVTRTKLYRAVLVENGKVVRSWEIVKCDFKVVGATLTDKDGNTFEVFGNIEVEPVE